MSNAEFQITDPEWATKLQSDFEDYIWACEETLTTEPEEPFVTLSGEEFCGCGTCFIREQLFFLIPAIIKAYKEGQVVLTEDEEGTNE